MFLVYAYFRINYVNNMDNFLLIYVNFILIFVNLEENKLK